MLNEALDAIGGGAFPPGTFVLKEQRSGLWIMNSRLPLLKGLLVAEPSAEACIAKAPQAIIELLWAGIDADGRLFGAFIAGFEQSACDFNKEFPFEKKSRDELLAILKPKFDEWVTATTPKAEIPMPKGTA